MSDGYRPTLPSLAPVLFGLIFVMSGWDWALLPETARHLTWILGERGLSMWIVASIIYVSRVGFDAKCWKRDLTRILFAGIGFFIATRVGYGSLLRAIQWEGPLLQKAWGWTQAVILGASWGLGAISLLVMFDSRTADHRNDSVRPFLLAFGLLMAGLLSNLAITAIADSLDKLADMVWTASIFAASVPLFRTLSSRSQSLLKRNIICCVITFIVGAMITSYFNTPASLAIDRHKIAEFAWGFGIGLGVAFISHNFYDETAPGET